MFRLHQKQKWSFLQHREPAVLKFYETSIFPAELASLTLSFTKRTRVIDES